MNEIQKKLLVSVTTSVVPLVIKGSVSLVKGAIEKKRSHKEEEPVIDEQDNGLFETEYVDFYQNMAFFGE